MTDEISLKQLRKLVAEANEAATPRPVREFNVGEITPEHLRLWNRLHGIIGEGGDEVWESEGGRRREYLDACVELHALLGLKPWNEMAIDAADPEPPEWMTDAHHRTDYRRAHRLYLALEAAAAAERPAQRPRKRRVRAHDKAAEARDP
jgi:hypothetical protein